MRSNVLKIGDVVSLKSHPYLENNTTIIVSGEPLLSSPLMVITEKVTLEPKGNSAEESNDDEFEYVCTYFSSKQHTFERVKIRGIHLKLIVEGSLENTAACDEIFPGVMVAIKTLDYELTKKKSSFSFEDNSLNNGSDNSTITALLSYLPPTLQVISVKPHKSKHPTHKKGKEIRLVPSWDVKCFWYNSQKETLSEEIFPLESLRIVVPPDEETIQQISGWIKESSTIKITELNDAYLFKPRVINYRSGYHFLRGYDFVLNRITEHKIAYPNVFSHVEDPIIASAPSFAIEKNPAAGTKDFIITEIKDIVEAAATSKNYIRIKYRNKHETLSLRTLKDFKYLEVEEEGEMYGYLIGFCCLRMDKRAFRIDRIQQIEEMNFKFKK